VTGAGVEAAFLPVGGGGVIVRRALSEASPGVYEAQGLTLARPGDWQMLVAVRLPGAAGIVYAPVDWRLGPDGALRLSSESMPWTARFVGWANAYGAGAVSGLALAAVAAWSWRAWRAFPADRRGAAAWWLAPGLLLAALAGYFWALWSA
jgi:hypothetical protein